MSLLVLHSRRKRRRVACSRLLEASVRLSVVIDRVAVRAASVCVITDRHRDVGDGDRPARRLVVNPSTEKEGVVARRVDNPPLRRVEAGSVERVTGRHAQFLTPGVLPTGNCFVWSVTMPDSTAIDLHRLCRTCMCRLLLRLCSAGRDDFTSVPR